MNTHHYNIPITGLTAALLLAVGAAGQASPGNTSKTRVLEEKKFIQLEHLRDSTQVANAKPGDSPAMPCSQCKTLWRSFTSRSASDVFFRSGGGIGRWPSDAGFARPASERLHYCPGCTSTITITGKGKSRKETIQHTCTVGGNNSPDGCVRPTKSAPLASYNSNHSAKNNSPWYYWSR